MNTPTGKAARTCDFLVVGAGIAGASAGYELSAHGRVIVLEREDAPGYHTTGRSAAQFLETYGNRSIRRLTRASRAFFTAPPEGFAEHPLLTRRAALFIAREDQLADLARFENEARLLVPTVERLSPREAAGLVPILRQDYLAAGTIEPEAMDIDVHALHHGYLRLLRRRGGEVVVNAQVAALSRHAGTWRAETRAGRFAAPVVIDAAGAWSDEIAGLAGARPIGLQPKRRTAIVFDGPDGTDCGAWPLVADIGETFYFKPESGRIMASPADETPMPPCDVQPDELEVAMTVERIETATTLKVRRIEHKWAGLRSFVADKSLVIGYDVEVQGFFWLAGQGGYGIQTAPAAARAAAALIVQGALPDDLRELGLRESDLSPRRLR